MTRHGLDLTRLEVLACRRTAQVLDQRLPPGPESLRHAAWAGIKPARGRAAFDALSASLKPVRTPVGDGLPRWSFAGSGIAA